VPKEEIRLLKYRDPRAIILAALQSEEEALRGELASTRAGLRESLRSATGESTVDNHPGELGTETFEREKDLGRVEGLENQLGQVAVAKERLAAGSYGICRACGRRIPPARLAARPHAALCLSCEEREEAGAHR